MKSSPMRIFATATALALVLPGCTNPQAAAPLITHPTDSALIPVTFTNVTQRAGINFSHNNGAFGAKLLPETMGSGAAFIDYDGDGYQDIVLVNGRDWTAAEIAAYRSGTGKAQAASLAATPPLKGGTCKLYHSDENGHFTDVTKGSGLDIPMFGMGVAVGDYDNDGKPDLYITAVGRNYLFHNEGGGKFKDVSDQAGVRDGGWSTSAAWVDYDRDGKLDLFVCHYVHWSPATDIWYTVDGKDKAYTTPDSYVGEESRLYHNLGNGKFEDVSAKAGILAQSSPARKLQGKSLGVSICDFNGDGWPDIAVANDTEPNYLFENNKDGTFKEVGHEVGVAVSEAGLARAAMGTDSSDFDHTGRDSLLFGNFSNQMIGLYKNLGNQVFVDVAPQSEVGPASLEYLSFGAAFVDIDNDGWPDIFTANGHLDREISKVQKHITYEERPLLFRNLHNARFLESGLTSGAALTQPIVGRGFAHADYNLEGAEGLLVTTNGGSPELLHNDGGGANNSVRLVLEGTKSNRSAIGTVVEAQIGADRLRRMVRSGSSYCSASELPITLGLGKAPAINSIKVTWPSSIALTLSNVPANQIVTIREGTGIVSTKPFPHHMPAAVAYLPGRRG